MNFNLDLLFLVTTHMISIQRVDWTMQHEMFKARDAKAWQRKFLVEFSVRFCALNLLFNNIFHDVVSRVESRCVIEAKHVLLVS